jgi:hypothetical protein
MVFARWSWFSSVLLPKTPKPLLESSYFEEIQELNTKKERCYLIIE